MLKKSLVLFSLLIALPVFSAYDPMSDEPIESVEQFYNNNEQEESSQPEFEYTTGEIPEVIEVKPSKDYAGIYHSLEPAKHSYMHDIDPDQFYDLKDASWAPYPLLRLNSYLYFKDRAIDRNYMHNFTILLK